MIIFLLVGSHGLFLSSPVSKWGEIDVIVLQKSCCNGHIELLKYWFYPLNTVKQRWEAHSQSVVKFLCIDDERGDEDWQKRLVKGPHPWVGINSTPELECFWVPLTQQIMGVIRRDMTLKHFDSRSKRGQSATSRNLAYKDTKWFLRDSKAKLHQHV